MQMGYFAVEVEGQNFPIDIDGVQTKQCFVTIQFVEAEDQQHAAKRAIELTRNHPGLRESVTIDPSDPPTMTIASISELDSFEGIDTHPGLVWYPMKKWWQFWK